MGSAVSLRHQGEKGSGSKCNPWALIRVSTKGISVSAQTSRKDLDIAIKWPKAKPLGKPWAGDYLFCEPWAMMVSATAQTKVKTGWNQLPPTKIEKSMTGFSPNGSAR
jgi:hypothetical protein